VIATDGGIAQNEAPVLQTSDSVEDVSRLRVAMGTIVAISADADTAERALSGIDAAFAVIEQVQRLMHPTQVGSDLAAIRRGRPGEPLAVHGWTWEVLALSRKLNQISKGAFDPCLPDSEGRLSDLELAVPQSVIPHRPLRIDLGGIAKGFAVDRALMAMSTAGCRGGLVNAGGDLAVFGERSHPIVIRRRSGGATLIELKNAALATSDAGNAGRPPEHRGYYQGSNRREIRAGMITINAPRAAIADALTKCVLAGRPDTNAGLLDAFGARLIAFELNP
jgi:FAD:protein FMN transferase